MEVMCLGLADPESTVMVLRAKMYYRPVLWMFAPIERDTLVKQKECLIALNVHL